ncbi:hypothetical protein IIC65_05150 [Candidatus Sumerlaeota bacterium]|nr:hypothetical protein [Candidatus Sumerlaeota bacterium]
MNRTAPKNTLTFAAAILCVLGWVRSDGQAPEEASQPGFGENGAAQSAAAPSAQWAIQDRLVLGTQVGYAEYPAPLKPGLWYPVWARIHAVETDVEGMLTFTQSGNELRVEIPLRIPKGTTQHLTAYYRLNEFIPVMTAEVAVEGVGLFSIPVLIPLGQRRDQHILVIAEERGAFNFLYSNESLDADAIVAVLGARSAIYGEVDLLPSDPIALEPLDAIVISTPRVSAIRADQWAAIQTWVAMGGRLLLAGGRHQPFIELSYLKDAFGLEVARPTLTTWTDALGASDPGAWGEASFLASWPSGGWDRIWRGDGEHPLLVGKRVGQGWFYFCAAALEEDTVDRIDASIGGEDLWARLLERHGDQTALQAVVDQAEGTIGYVMQRPFVSSLAGFGWAAGFLGIYILLALPVNWWVSARFNRRGFRWPVAMTLAITFALYGYASGTRNQEKEFRIHEFTLIHRPSRSAPARATTLSTVFSPRRFRSDLTTSASLFPGPMKEPGRLSYSNLRIAGTNTTPLTLSFQSGVSLNGFFLNAWTSRSLRSDVMIEPAGAIRIEEPIRRNSESPAALEGTILNGTSWTFRKWWILHRRTLWEGTSPLESNDSARLENATRAAAGHVAGLLRSTIRDTLNSSPQVPAAGESPGGGNLSNDVESLWSSLDRPYLTSGDFIFVGEVEGSSSPLMDSLGSGVRLGRTLYEQILGPSVSESLQSIIGNTGEWTPIQIRPGLTDRSAFNTFGAPSATVLKFSSRKLELQFIPDRALESGFFPPLAFSFTLSSFPEEPISVG